MAQESKPNKDLVVGGWTNPAGKAHDLWMVFKDPNSYIQSELAPSQAPCVFQLEGLEDPVTGEGHMVSYQYQKNADGGKQIDITVELREAYASEDQPGRLIARGHHGNVPAGWQSGSFALTKLEADAIRRYDDLYLRVVAHQP